MVYARTVAARQGAHASHHLAEVAHVEAPPWSLVLLSLPDVAEGRQHAKRIVSSFDSADHSDPAIDDAIHHRLTL